MLKNIRIASRYPVDKVKNQPMRILTPPIVLANKYVVLPGIGAIIGKIDDSAFLNIRWCQMAPTLERKGKFIDRRRLDTVFSRK